MNRLLTLALILFGLSANHALAQTASATSGGGTYNYCIPSTGQRPQLTLLLVDRSAKYTHDDVQRLYRGIAALETAMTQTGHRLVVRSVRDLVSTSEQLFDGCAPACPTNLPFYDSCNLQGVGRDRQNFWQGLQRAINQERLMAETPSNQETALAETIEASLRALPPPTRLIIFSDFLEHHAAGGGLPKVSFYSPMTDKERSAYLDSLRMTGRIPKLGGTIVEGFGFGQELGGPSNASLNTHVPAKTWEGNYRFWISYFQMAGVQDGISISLERGGQIPPLTGDIPPSPVKDRTAIEVPASKPSKPEKRK